MQLKLIMVIKLTPNCIAKMKQYAICADTSEIGGFLLGTTNANGDIKIKDAIIIEQVKTGSTFEINEKDLMELTKNASAEFLEKIVGWWHSHVNFGVFWSSTDSDTFKRLTELNGVCVGIVISYPDKEKMDMKTRLDIKNINNIYMSIDNIKPEINTIFPAFINKKKIKNEVALKLKDDNRTFENSYKEFNNGFQKQLTPEEIQDLISSYNSNKQKTRINRSIFDWEEEYARYY